LTRRRSNENSVIPIHRHDAAREKRTTVVIPIQVFRLANGDQDGVLAIVQIEHDQPPEPPEVWRCFGWCSRP
jgi:hypothetical protein